MLPTTTSASQAVRHVSHRRRRGSQTAMDFLGGLAIVGLLLATVLIGIAASLDARSRWLDMSDRARRFVRSERFSQPQFRRRGR